MRTAHAASHLQAKPVPMESLQAVVNMLEEVLVREFRSLQALHTLSLQERHALLHGDAAGVADVQNGMQTLQNRLLRLYRLRNSLLQRAAGQPRRVERAIKSNDQPPSGAPFLENSGTFNPEFSALLGALDEQTADRLARLQDGIQILGERARILLLGNQALAGSSPYTAQQEYAQRPVHDPPPANKSRLPIYEQEPVVSSSVSTVEALRQVPPSNQ